MASAGPGNFWIMGARFMGAMQEVLIAAVLAEGVYKVVDHGSEGAAAITEEILRDLVPPQLSGSVVRVQWCLPHVRQRFLLAETEDVLYVAFMGTKLRHVPPHLPRPPREATKRTSRTTSVLRSSLGFAPICKCSIQSHRQVHAARFLTTCGCCVQARPRDQRQRHHD